MIITDAEDSIKKEDLKQKYKIFKNQLKSQGIFIVFASVVLIGSNTGCYQDLVYALCCDDNSEITDTTNLTEVLKKISEKQNELTSVANDLNTMYDEISAVPLTEIQKATDQLNKTTDQVMTIKKKDRRINCQRS